MNKQIKQIEQIRDFVKIPNKDGVSARIGIIVSNDRCGGVLRGHANIWFGEISNLGSPIIYQLAITDKWELVNNIEQPFI